MTDKKDKNKSDDGAQPQSLLDVVKHQLYVSKMQIGFFFGITATLSGLVPFTRQVGQFLERAKALAPPDYNFPELADLKMSLYFMAAIFVTHVIWLKIVPPLLEPIIKVQDNEKEKKKRARKMALMIYSLIWYTTSSIWGYTILKDTDFFPTYLGGRGDLQKTFNDYPFQKEVPGMRLCYQANLGWHLEGLLKMIVLDGIRPDIIEMSLHHIVTIYLVGGSYLINYVNVGTIIEWIHNTTDILLSMLRASSECKYHKILAPPILVLCAFFWFFGRIVVFSGIIYVMHTTEVMSSENGDNYIMQYIVYGVTMLLFLNLWWLKCLGEILFTALFKNKYEDTQAHFVEDQNKLKTKNDVGDSGKQ